MLATRSVSLLAVALLAWLLVDVAAAAWVAWDLRYCKPEVVA